jgi:hypothetical protein
MTAAIFQMPAGPAIPLTLAPRLESWNARDHRDQVALRAWLAHVHEPRRALEERTDGALALRVDIGLPQAVDPLWQRDLDNYLYPIGRELPPRYVSVWATKGRGDGSYLRIEPAIPLSHGELAEWAPFRVPRSSRGEHGWKRAVASALAGAEELPAGPVALQVAFVVGSETRWQELWKPTIDGLEAVLGRALAEPSWNPQDGRITRLGLHLAVSAGLGRDVEARIWARAAPLEWPENAWLLALPRSERSAFMQQHAARITRSQAAVRAPLTHNARVSRTKRALVDEPGVVVFADADAAYERWLSEQPAGFVLNVLGTPASGVPMLHAATCHTISGTPARGRTWTSADYIKACSLDRHALTRWLAANGTGDAQACGTCSP